MITPYKAIDSNYFQLSRAHDQDRTGDLVLTKDALYRLSYVGWDWSGRRDSNPRPIAWKAMTLPTELLPLSIKNNGGEGRIRTFVVHKHAGFTAQCH